MGQAEGRGLRTRVQPEPGRAETDHECPGPGARPACRDGYGLSR